jgi:AGZA family xanthine/uracil permease-like MFS transporter
MTDPAQARPPLFVAGDLDGFFGLALDNLIQFLLILGLSTGVIGIPVEHVLGVVLPGAALSIVIGNFFYARQALELAKKTGRKDVTALPYGINTVSLFAYVFLVMLPVKLEAIARGIPEGDAAMVAWQVGLGACLVSALIEIAGAFVADRIRKATPRAALLATLSGIAISFIAIDFAVQTFESPLVAFLPLAIILTTYFGRIKLPFRIPGGAWAVLAGTALAWFLFAIGSDRAPVDPNEVVEGAQAVSFYFPLPVIGDLIAGITHPLFVDFLVPVMLPMGLFNVLGSLQNIESAEAAGDSYPALPSLLVNGIGSVAAAAFGSCFPTTIYIGHPGWKALGARAGYSVLNGIFFAVVALFGLTSLVGALVPMQSGIAIVLWIGIVITAQAFQTTPKEHAPAVAFGLFPAIAGFGLMILGQAVNAAGNSLGDFELAGRVLADRAAFARAGVHLDGLVALSQGFMLTSMVWASASALLIDRRFVHAAIWMLIGAALAFFGFMHAGSVGPAGGVFEIGFGTGWPWAVGYALCAGFFALVHLYRKRTGEKSDDVEHM